MVNLLIQQLIGHGQFADLGVEANHLGLVFFRTAGQLFSATRQKYFAPLGQLGGANLKLAIQNLQRLAAQQPQDGIDFVSGPEPGRRQTLVQLLFITHFEHSFS